MEVVFGISSIKNLKNLNNAQIRPKMGPNGPLYLN